MSIKDNNLFKKALILFAFSIILLIPLFFISNIIEERSGLYVQSSNEIGNSWAKAQSITGPIITVPYTTVYYQDELVKNKNGNDVTIKKKGYDKKTAIFLPEVFNANIDIKDSVRNRGIYKSIVYTADVELDGYFHIPSFSKVDQIVIDSISWREALISLGITDPRAIINIKEFKVGNEDISINAGVASELTNSSKIINGGSAGISLKGEVAKLPFTIKMEIKGSNSFNILPIGDNNDIIIKSTWANPSFKGSLPNSREINGDGFTANWSITNLAFNQNRDFSARVGNGYDNKYDIRYDNNENNASIGVEFYQGITHYRQVIRATKYAYLFIALSLLVLFLFEVVGKRPIHFLQYAIIGVSLAIFYLVLLALSEHIPFIIAYLISALAIVIPITLYTISFLKNKRYGLGICATLTGLYLVLLSILQIEDYALLTGTCLIMVVLYTLMYLTRHVRAEQAENKKQ